MALRFRGAIADGVVDRQNRYQRAGETAEAGVTREDGFHQEDDPVRRRPHDADAARLSMTAVIEELATTRQT